MVSDQMFQRKPGSDERVMSASADHLWCASGVRFQTKFKDFNLKARAIRTSV